MRETKDELNGNLETAQSTSSTVGILSEPGGGGETGETSCGLDQVGDIIVDMTGNKILISPPL